MTTFQAQASVTALSVNVNLNANVSLQGPQLSNPTHASTVKEGGLVKFENDNYRITAGDNNEVNILDKHTGESTRIWGDPHVDVNGKRAFDFWGTTTFALKDGTKLTIETTPFNQNPQMTLASKVTITNGDYGVQISGVDTNKVGDLSFEEGKGWGKMIDAVVADGNTVYAKQNGGGFEGVDDAGHLRNVDQNFINETDLSKGGAWKAKLEGLLANLSSLVSIISVGLFGSHQGGSQGGEGAHHHHHFPHLPKPDFGPVFQLPKLPSPPVFNQPVFNLQASAQVQLTQVSFALNRSAQLA